MTRFAKAIAALVIFWTFLSGALGSDLRTDDAQRPDYVGRTYYISPTGNDRNDGLSQSHPWLTPNHPLNCGDTILAAAGRYNSNFFVDGRWGAVSNCPSTRGVYFARLLCIGPYVSSCSIADRASNAVWVDKSNWAVVGWTGSSTKGACFEAVPSGSYNIHYIAFINVVANGCKNGGIVAYRYYGANQYGVDEFGIVGAVIYDAAGGPSECFSGLSIYEPVNVDRNPGTHIFVAGVFSISNIDPDPCAGGAPTDGEGFIFDTFQGNGYTGESVIEQSMAIGNGSGGFEVLQNTSAPTFIFSSTAWGDFRDSSHVTGGGELFYDSSTALTSATNDIFQATKATLNSSPVHGAYVYAGNSNDIISGNNIFGTAGNDINIRRSPGFSAGSNIYAMPNFVNPLIPRAVDCSGFETTTACMKETIANFTPRANYAQRLGYQPPGGCAPDRHFPMWLKSMIPAGIITKPCRM